MNILLRLTSALSGHAYFLLYIIAQTGLRLALTFQTHLTPKEIVPALFVGVIYDLFIWYLFSAPFRWVSILLPDRAKRFIAKSALVFLSQLFLGVIFFFVVASEWNFWAEFHSRFNFIAVDYIVYSKEVLDNILESFPMGKIFAGIGFLSLVFAGLLTWLWRQPRGKELLKPWPRVIFLSVVAPALLGLVVLPALDQIFPVFPQEQISRNSYLEFYRAFRSNKISYQQYYRTIPVEEAEKIVKENRPSLNPSELAMRPNVVLIIQESLGAKFIKDLGGSEDATPNLNALTEKSLFFTKLYSTGTRTVRGLEAISLSVPPTPGYAMVKRPQQPGIASIGSVFGSHGYTKKFIYGGYGYFDNMNAFYENLGFEIVDKTDFAKDEVTFSNAWGACDEDLYNKILKEGDKDSASKKPFLHVILTTSNHRPFTYPEGKIDIPSGTSRKGAVKYTDYAVGKFLRDVEKKSWFKNTLFIVVADHSTEGRGEYDLDMNDFHIPMWIYAPDMIKPSKITKLGSQIDLLPTIFSLLHWKYTEPFFGHDLLHTSTERAFIGNYQQVGYFENGELVTLYPVKKVKYYTFNPDSKTQVPEKEGNPEHEKKAIAYYETASWWLDKGKYRP